jgi:hypothetical protein
MYAFSEQTLGMLKCVVYFQAAAITKRVTSVEHTDLIYEQMKKNYTSLRETQNLS